jgi:putative FmdB family regulatory protein
LPTYTFRCRKCGATIEVEHPITGKHPERHEGCGGLLGRIFNSQKDPIYRGDGFYSTEKRLETPSDTLE